jgi:catechol 2,3-dioxygenase-like lactoylglutathione lyase family enzyme
MPVPIEGIDHVVVMASDVDRSLDFYKNVLGGEAEFEEAFRMGKIPVLRVRIGKAIINLQRLNEPAYIVADRLESGTVDLCFRWSRSIQEAIDWLKEKNVDVIEGPVPRPAANGVWGQSIYFRDPDGNLLELLTTLEPSEPIPEFTPL